MSSNVFSATLDLRPRHSLRGAQLMVVLHIIAVGLLFLAEPPNDLGMVLAGLLLLSWYFLRRHPAFGFGPKALSRLTWHAEDHAGGSAWSLETEGGDKAEAELLPSTLVTSWMLVLNFRLADGRRRSRALLGDELDTEALRRLRARLLSGEALAKPKDEAE